jgi:transcription antitermination factor NusG
VGIEMNGADNGQALQWFACYTRPRNEKTSFKKLTEAGYECYLPLQRTRRRWSDRWKWVDEPLFKSYLFVRIAVSACRPVLEAGNLVRFITFEGKAAPIPDKQIDIVKRLLNQDIELEVSDQRFKPGQEVEVVAGPLLGLTGELVEYRGTHKMLVRLGEIGQGLLVTIGSENLSSLTKYVNKEL